MSEIENVRVIIRLRPLNKRELETNSLNVTQVDEQKQQITIKKPGSQSSDVPKTYRFDHILTEDSTQVYSNSYSQKHSLVLPLFLF